MRYFVTPGEDRRLDAVSRQNLRGSFVELSDGVTHYELSGPDAGEVAVLVGGITIPLFYWDNLVSELHARGLRTLAYSGYGRGYSDRVQARYDEALFVRQLTELTERLGLTRPYHVVGASMGALTAMVYAGQQVAAISTLTLANPAGLARRAGPPPWLVRSDRLAGFVAKRFGRQSSRLSGRAELYRRTGSLGVPTMLVWGTDDQVTPIDSLAIARALLQPQKCHVFECGHMAPFECPRDVADQIASFAASPTKRVES